MTGVKLPDTFQDVPKQGMPPENVQALKAYLEAKRPEGRRLSEQAREDKLIAKLPETCKTLPRAMQLRLAEFLEEIQNTKFMQPDGRREPFWHVSCGDTWESARVKAFEASLTAAKDGAFNSAYHAVEAAVKGVGRAEACDAARGVAWRAVNDAAPNEPKFLADAMNGATLLAMYLVAEDIDFPGKEKHLAHAKARWEVFKRGYGMLSDLGDVFYVYCGAEEPETSANTSAGPAKPAQATKEERGSRVANMVKRVINLLNGMRDDADD